MNKILIILLFITLTEAKGQAVPRFLWNPVVKPYEFVPNPDNNNARQKDSIVALIILNSILWVRLI